MMEDNHASPVIAVGILDTHAERFQDEQEERYARALPKASGWNGTIQRKWFWGGLIVLLFMIVIIVIVSLTVIAPNIRNNHALLLQTLPPSVPPTTNASTEPISTSALPTEPPQPPQPPQQPPTNAPVVKITPTVPTVSVTTMPSVVGSFVPTGLGWNQWGQDLNGIASFDYFGDCVALSSNGNIVAFGSAFHDGVRGPRAGRVLIYVYSVFDKEWLPLQGGPSTMSGVLEGDGADDGFGAGCALSANGQTLAVLAARGGYVRVLDVSLSRLNAVRMGTDVRDGFMGGKDSVSLSDDGRVLAVGAPHGTNETTNVYTFDGNDWTSLGQTLSLPNDMEHTNSSFGGAVSLSGDGTRVAVGASRETFGGGLVMVYEYNNNDTWVPIGQTLVGAPDQFERFGFSVSLSGNTLAVGATGNDEGATDAGQATIYTLMNNDTWQLLGNPISGVDAQDASATSVALSDDGRIVAIGASRHGESATGHVRVFRYDNTANEWVLMGDVDGQALGDFFGHDVALSGNGLVLAASAPYHNGMAEVNPQRDIGQVRVFAYN